MSRSVCGRRAVEALQYNRRAREGANVTDLMCLPFDLPFQSSALFSAGLSSLFESSSWPGAGLLAIGADPGGAAPAAVAAAAGELFSVTSLISLLTLAALEIVLGIDNVIFIAILAGRLPQAEQARARKLGIGMAVISRILLLLGITWVMGLTRPLFSLAGFDFSGKQLILLLGGLFLIAKATYEIHDKLEGEEAHGTGAGAAKAALASVVLQIMLIDIVFSLDSVITAVGMTPHIELMIVAVLVAAAIMLIFAGPISEFVQRHPTMKMLALAFLILIGVMLVAESFGQHVDKGYIYFAMAFSLGVELLNLRMKRKQRHPVELRHSALPEA